MNLNREQVATVKAYSDIGKSAFSQLKQQNENDDFDGELPSDSSFSNPLKGLVGKAMSKEADIKERVHKLEQQSYFKPEIVRLFDSNVEEGKILQPNLYKTPIRS